MSDTREQIERKIDSSSDALCLIGAATILEHEANAAESDGHDAVAALYRAHCARLQAMAEALEPSSL